MGVEEDERVEASPNDGYEEPEEPEERDESAESAAESSERAEAEQPEQRLGTDYFGAESEQAQAEDATEADEATTAEVVGVAGEPAAWSDPAEPYIGPGLAAEPVAEEEPESGYEQAPVEEVTSTYVTTPAYQVGQLGQPSQEPSAAGSEYSERMREIQLEFIDDPRQAARDADGLIEDLLRGLTADLQRRRSEFGSGLLKTTDAQADEVAPPTEDLRVSVQRSRELVDLLAQARERAVL